METSDICYAFNQAAPHKNLFILCEIYSNSIPNIILSLSFSLSSHLYFSIFFLSSCVYRHIVVPQSYSVNVMDEHILRGNAAIIKCHIPSFVIDFVYVSAWILDENSEIIEILADHNGIDINTIGIVFMDYIKSLGLRYSLFPGIFCCVEMLQN